MRPERRQKNAWLPPVLVSFSVFIFTSSFVGIAANSNWLIKLVLILLNGNAISWLFTMGHDAGHGSFTTGKRLNTFIGRLVFLPSFTPFCCWRYFHNYLHHGYTCCKEKDFAWRPLSLEEYRALPWHLRWLERSYKTVPGLAINWIVELVIKRHLFPSRAARVEIAKWGEFTFDRRIVTVWFFVEAAAAALLTRWYYPQAGLGAILENVAACVILPYLTWCTLIGYTTLLHHTHPQIRWYDGDRAPGFAHVQLEGTTQIVYPFPFGFIHHNIMEHTAHHVDTNIPMYQLRRAQRELSAGHPGRIVIEFFSLPYLLRILRVCKLYDFAAHQWIGFDGRPTAPPIGRTQDLAEQPAPAV